MNVLHKNVMKLFLLFLLCISLAACSENEIQIAPSSQAHDPEFTEAPSLPSESVEPLESSESIPAFHADVLKQVAGDDDLWVEFYHDGNLLRRFFLFSPASLYWEDTLTDTDPPQTTPSEYIRFVRDDGTSELSVYPGSPDLIRCIHNGDETWYCAMLQENSAYSLYSLLKQNLSGYLQNSYGRLSFSCEGSGEQILEAYVKTAYPEYAGRKNQFGKYGFTDYEALAWEITKTDTHLIIGLISYAVRYEYPELAAGLMIDGGTETPGTGEYEGWNLIQRQVILEQHSDGLWYEVDNNDYLAATTDNGSSIQTTPEAVADAEEFLTTVVQQAQALGTGVEDLAELTGLFLRTAHAVAVTGNDAFDWSWICTEDAVENVGMQSLLNYPYIFNGSYQPNFIFIENELAIVYHYEAIVYYRFTEGKWFVEDIVRPFVIP